MQDTDTAQIQCAEHWHGRQYVPDGPQGQMFTRTRGSENGQRVYSVLLAVLWKAGGRKKRVRMRAWEGVLAGRPYACALTTV